MVVDGLRFFDRARKRHTLRLQWIRAGALQAFHFLIVLFFVCLEKLERVDRHRTVNVNGQNGNLIFDFKLAQRVKDLLRPPYGEGRNQNRSSAFCRGENHITQLFLTVLTVFVCVKAIAVRGFKDQIFRRVDWGRIQNDRLVVMWPAGTRSKASDGES